MNEPPLPHLTGEIRNPTRKPTPVLDKNTAQFVIGLALFQFVVFLFLSKTIIDSLQRHHGWDYVRVLVLCTIVGFGASAWLLWYGITEHAKSEVMVATVSDAALGETAMLAQRQIQKLKPLALAIICFAGFLFKTGFAIQTIFLAGKYAHPSMDNIIALSFSSFGCLAASIWAFRWWLRERKATRP